MTASRTARLLLSLVLLAAVACGGDAPGDGESEEPAATVEGSAAPADSDSDEPTATGTGIPEGGLEQWVADIRGGLEQVELEPRSSHERVLELYATRQEYIEMFYGPGGRITGQDHPELAEAVMEQEARFHDLMEYTGSTEPLQREWILGRVQDLRLATNRTIELAREAGLPLDRVDAEEM